MAETNTMMLGEAIDRARSELSPFVKLSLIIGQLRRKVDLPRVIAVRPGNTLQHRGNVFYSAGHGAHEVHSWIGSEHARVGNQAVGGLEADGSG